MRSLPFTIKGRRWSHAAWPSHMPLARSPPFLSGMSEEYQMIPKLSYSPGVSEPVSVLLRGTWLSLPLPLL